MRRLGAELKLKLRGLRDLSRGEEKKAEDVMRVAEVLRM